MCHKSVRSCFVFNNKYPVFMRALVFCSYHADGMDLSGGEKQKLAIARMLHKDTAVMILDEPIAALDPIAERELLEKEGKFYEFYQLQAQMY